METQSVALPHGIDEALNQFPADFKERVSAYAGDLRRPSFMLTLALAKCMGVKYIVETGTIRTKDAPDGQSTRIFAEYARLTGAKFYSIDLNPNHIAMSKSEVGELLPYVEHICDDSVAWLSRCAWPIDLLYLDSYDFDFDNPGPSQRHELAEIGAAYGKIRQPAAILLDDCAVENEGKGYLGTRFLQDRGWKLVLDAYQRLFINF